MFKIIQAGSSTEIEEARNIFREYEAWLGLDLCFQGFEEELRTLPGKYAPPDGRLYLAWKAGQIGGCIALRKLVDGVCEMKRLFVREPFRGQRLGQTLIETLLEDARGAGYKKMRLDTFPPKMAKAVKLYKSYGFREILPYYENPHGETLFMETNL